MILLDDASLININPTGLYFISFEWHDTEYLLTGLTLMNLIFPYSSMIFESLILINEILFLISAFKLINDSNDNEKINFLMIEIRNWSF